MRYYTLIYAVLLCSSIAQESQNSNLLDPITITATRFVESVSNVPNSVEIIEERDILEEMPRGFPSVFSSSPAVQVQKTANGKGSPFIRGFTGFRNLLLIDGVRLNNAAFREGPNQYWGTVDPLIASRIELIKGQGSVLYGSDAIGGTVNIITKDATPLSYEENKSFAEGQLIYRGSSAEQSHTGRVEGTAGVGQKTGVIMGYTGRSIGNIRTAGLGELPYTGYSENGIDLRVDHYFRQNVRGIFSFQKFDQDNVWRVHKTIYAKPWEGTSVGNELQRSGDQSRTLAYAQVKADELGGPIQKIHTSLSWHHHQENRLRIKSNQKGDFQGFDLDGFGSWVQMESDSIVGKLTYGASYYQDIADTYRNDLDENGKVTKERIQGPFGDDAIYKQLGFFVQDRLKIADQFDIDFGSRFTNVIADIERFKDPESGEAGQIHKDWNNISNSVRGIYKPDGNEMFNIFGGASQGFRAPNFSDLSRLDSARSNEIETPSPNLNPEKFVSYEIGSRFNNEKFQLGVSCFYTDIQDMIVRTPTGRMIENEFEVIKKNGSKGYVYGMELDGSYQINDWLNAFGALAFNDGMADTYPDSTLSLLSEPVSRLLPLNGTLGLRCNLGDSQWIELSTMISDKQDKLNTRDQKDIQRIPPGGTPGYVIFNVRYGLQLNEQVLLTAGIDNITDQDYRIHGSGQNEPGINFIFGASINF